MGTEDQQSRGNAANDELKEARELTNIDISAIVNEVNARLAGKQARLDQFYQLGDSHFVFRFKTKDERVDLIFRPPKFLFLRNSERPEAEPNPFVAALKNNFLNRILRSARQIQNDRILSLEFDDGSIVLECIKKGNAILLKEGAIVNLNEEETMKDRKLELNGKYVPPATTKREIGRANVIEALDSKEKIVVAITRSVAMPALYANEILNELGFDPKKESSKLKPEEAIRIAERMEMFHKNIIESKTEVIQAEMKYIVADRELGEKLRKENKEIKTFDSLSQVLSSLYQKETSGQIKKVKEKKMNQLLSRLDHQENRARQVEAEIQEEKRKGEWIISNMEKVNSIAREYKMIKAQNDKQKLEEFLKRNGAVLIKNGMKLEI